MDCGKEQEHEQIRAHCGGLGGACAVIDYNTEPENSPSVTGSPDAIWLVYGELDHDDTHRELCASGEVTWCEAPQHPADVRYTRTDLVAERVRAALAAQADEVAQLRQALQEADTLMGHDQGATEWRERWASLWPTFRGEATPTDWGRKEHDEQK